MLVPKVVATSACNVALGQEERELVCSCDRRYVLFL